MVRTFTWQGEAKQGGVGCLIVEGVGPRVPTPWQALRGLRARILPPQTLAAVLCAHPTPWLPGEWLAVPS